MDYYDLNDDDDDDDDDDDKDNDYDDNVTPKLAAHPFNEDMV